MSAELRGRFALDAGALLELVLGTAAGNVLKESMLSGKIDAWATEIAIAELRYILCRKYGRDMAAQRVHALLASGYVRLCHTEILVERASDYKCARALSLPDCFTLALSSHIDAPALFARREQELVREMSRKKLDVEIFFLEEAAGGAK